MNRFPAPLRIVQVAATLLLLLVLTACGFPAPPQEAGSGRFAAVASVDIASTDTRAVVEARYGGSVVVFRPEAGFAVLGFSAEQADLTTLTTDPNQDGVAAPEVDAAGWTAWAGGWTAWAGGWTAWSGGWTAWSGGSETPSTFGENLAIWDQINLPEAQDLAPDLGGGVKVAVIDTGIDLTHPGFAGKLAPVSEWRDYVDGDAFPMDEPGGDGYGHGTGVAGVVLQVAPEATLLPLRVLGPDGSGDVDDVVAAIDHAVAMGVKVINLSLGSTADLATLRTMTEYAADQGVFVVASAGNSGDQQVTYPAAYARGPGNRAAAIHRIVGVGSVDRNDALSSFSTSGPALEMVAPGEDLLTLIPGRRVSSWSGTSFAAPVVSGALALAISKYPSGWVHQGLGAYLNDSAQPLTSELGNGRLDVEAFVRKAAFWADEW